jgi:NitT/TauT family transport system substrate-binding protein
VEAGLFAPEGLDVDLTRVDSSARALPAMLAGEVPISLLATGAVATAVAQGADVALLATSAGKLVFQLMVPPQITSAEQLRGQSVGVSGRGGAGDFATRYALRRPGLDPDQDVVIRAVPGGDAGLGQALLSGTFLAGALGPPSDFALQQQGFRSLARMSDWNVPYTGTGPGTTRGYIATNRDTVRRFMRGFLRSIQRAKADQPYALAIMRQYSGLEDDQALEWGYQQYIVGAVEPAPYASEEGLQTVLDSLAEEVLEVARVTPSAMLDASILRELDAEGFIADLYR